MHIEEHAGLLSIYNCLQKALALGDEKAVVHFAQEFFQEWSNCVNDPFRKNPSTVLYIPFSLGEIKSNLVE